MTKSKTYRVDVDEGSAHLLKECIQVNFESWANQLLKEGYGEDLQPVILSGFHVTNDDLNVMCTEKDDTIDNQGFWPGGQKTKLDPAKVPIETFPQAQETLPKENSPRQLMEVVGDVEIPKEFKRCIFIRYYTMRIRSEMANRTPV